LAASALSDEPINSEANMHDESDFLRKLLENPADDTVRFVYADWLDERADEESKLKSQFLRLTAKLLEPNRTAGWRKARRKEMQPLAAKLPTNWLAIVSRLKVEGCRAKVKEPTPGLRFSMDFVNRAFTFVCDRNWDEMAPTEDNAVRRCEQCQENVHYCDTLAVAREHAQQGHCIAVDLGIIRREDDLSPHRMWAGRPSAETLRKEEERWKLDTVSIEREAQKRLQSEGESTT
jgi:uncharacterized protein (TIGR02996 family)